MSVLRPGKAKQLLQIHLPGRRGKKILTAHHLGNTGLPVIYRHSKLIDINTVCPTDHKITAIPQKIFPIFALDKVLYSPFSIRNLYPPGRGPPKALTLDICQSLQCDVSESVKLIRFAENALFIVSTNGDEIIVRGGVVEGG